VHVLVTGGAGFLGSHLAERLLLEGHAVTVVDRMAPDYDRSLKERNLAGIRPQARARFLELDLARADLAPALEGVTAVAHFAARLGDGVPATERLLEAVRGRDLTVFVHASSANVYGTGSRVPVDEDAPMEPRTPQGIAKLAAEHLVRRFRLAHGVPTVVLRYFTAYGPRERPDHLIATLLAAARGGTAVDLSDREAASDLTYVGDVVEGTVAALVRAPVGETFNLGRGRTTPLADVVATVERVTGTRLNARPPAPPTDRPGIAAGIDRAFRLLDYVPQVDLETGIRRQWRHATSSAG
jgi:nucleoside-diphosphate-sugar epimerase